MTEHRRPTIRFTDAPRGTCRWCGEEILYQEGKHAGSLDRRRRWHPECVAEYNLSDPREARGWLRRRQRGFCQDCGLDTYQLRRELQKIRRGRAAEMRERGFNPRKSLWELDHILPLIDGGTHARENLQTLCVPCHRKKSAGEARSRALRRKEEACALEAMASPALEEERPASAKAARKEPRRKANGKAPPKRKTGTSGRPSPSRASRRKTADLDGLLKGADEANARARQLLDALDAPTS